MRRNKTRAVVLRRTNYGEADRILHLLTPEGKRNVIARGVRREKSRLAGGIELFAVCDVVIGEGKGDLDILVSSRLIHFYSHIMGDYDRMKFAYDVIKYVARASEMVDEPEWYDVLVEILAGLDVYSINLKMIQTWFYLRYSMLLGHELSLQYDVAGKKLESGLKYQYDASEKGLKINEDGNITSDHIKLLRLISTKLLKTLAQIGGVDTVLDECLLVTREHAAI